MTEKERLIKLLDDLFQAGTEKTLGDMADYLLDNGVICPPCKVGDTVYFASFDCNGNNKGIKPHNVLYLSCEAVCEGKTINSHIDFEDFGKTVFFTHEEAKKALMRSEDSE